MSPRANRKRSLISMRFLGWKEAKKTLTDSYFNAVVIIGAISRSLYATSQCSRVFLKHFLVSVIPLGAERVKSIPVSMAGVLLLFRPKDHSYGLCPLICLPGRHYCQSRIVMNVFRTEFTLLQRQYFHFIHLYQSSMYLNNLSQVQSLSYSSISIHYLVISKDKSCFNRICRAGTNIG